MSNFWITVSELAKMRQHIPQERRDLSRSASDETKRLYTTPTLTRCASLAPKGVGRGAVAELESCDPQDPESKAR